MKFEFIVLASGFHPEHTVVMDRCTLEADSTADAARGYAALFAPLEAKDEQAVLTPELAGEMRKPGGLFGPPREGGA